MPLKHFHPAVASWFDKTFTAPTEPQKKAWPAIAAGRHVLIAAPTGSGKTLAAFLASIDELVRQAVAGTLADETQIVYVSPLKALSNDIQRNLDQPLAAIQAELAASGFPGITIRTFVRTGDTPQAERAAMRKRAPHIIVTTPESLYILLTSDSGRSMLATTRTVIVDEIHALIGSKRGAHLALSLERLQSLSTRPITRVGLSATQKPIEDVARFLVGNNPPTIPCTIVNTGHARSRDLALELPGSPLEAVMSNEVWEHIYDRLAVLAQDHRTTLVFVNTRRMAERVARHLSERLGEDQVASHHGSLAKEHRLGAEQCLKAGSLRALVATASLELGIDIGDVELVCQIGSPRSIATFLQRVGRSGHSVGGLPKGRLFPLSRDELIESIALLDAVERGELDRLIVPEKPLDVLAQQIVAEVACREWAEDELFTQLSRAYPYRNLTQAEFSSLIHMLAEGYSTKRGRHSAYLHYDSVNRRLRARRGARLTAITCGGTIPDNADYDVILEPAGLFIGTLNEDFAIESMAGDIFQLGNTSYRILRVEAGRVRVEDAHGQPPSIPFWVGEGSARTDELSFAVARLRDNIALQLIDRSVQETTTYLVDKTGICLSAAAQAVEYLAAAYASLGSLPTQQTIIFERFFDTSGGMQFIIHSPFGSRINRAWGLALRKRFCRKFNFELQAAATEDAIILSLGATHSFPLSDVANYLHPNTVKEVLVQALLDSPMFTARWRWNATTALAIQRFRGGKKVAPPLRRMAAEDLVALLFPDQLACQENIQGEREIPDHPLVNQTIHDCLHEAMDIDGLKRLLNRLITGKIKLIAKDLREPSPLAQEILTAKPYAFLDDAPLEERRTQAVLSRRWLDPNTASDLGRLDEDAIARVKAEIWPKPENADELHEALMLFGFLTKQECTSATWEAFFQQLKAQKRATELHTPGHTFWVCAERLPILAALFPDASLSPAISAPTSFSQRTWTYEEALVDIVRSRLEGLGPIASKDITKHFGLPAADIEQALVTLEGEGFVLRGNFCAHDSVEVNIEEWCERRLLARIHHYTIKRLRQEIEPVSASDFMRFLFRWQHIGVDKVDGPKALANILEQLEGFEAPASAWESDILPLRLSNYDPHWLDALCQSGRISWARLNINKAVQKSSNPGPLRSTPISLMNRRQQYFWRALVQESQRDVTQVSPGALRVTTMLSQHGACFFDELLDGTGLLRIELESALGELVARGFITNDSFAGLRALLMPSDLKRSNAYRRHSRNAITGIDSAGRWSRIAVLSTDRDNPADKAYMEQTDPNAVEHVARTLLKRYGVVFRRLLEREAAWLPSWRELLIVYRRLEARGEIRGGHFVAGFSGEHFALPEAVGALRQIRREPPSQNLIVICGADPLNQAGITTPGTKIPSLINNRVLYRDGVPIAWQVAGEFYFMGGTEPSEEWTLRQKLIRKTLHSGPLSSPRLAG